MSEQHPIVKWIGASGTEYRHYVWELPANFKANQDGNYIYSKLNQDSRWVPIYIGEGDLKARMENHHKADSIRRKGATHVHVHLNLSEEDRLKEERDLLANYTNAYEPNGCNELEGG